MVSARERPDVSGHAVQELDFDEFLFGGNEIPESNFQILWAERRGSGEQLITCAACKHDEIGGMFFACGGELDLLGRGLDASDARVHRLASGGFSAVKQEAVQDSARINHERAGHLEAGAVATTGNKLGAVNFLLCGGAFQQERILFDGLVRQAAAAGLFPREMFVKESDAEPGTAQFLGAESPSRPASHNGNLLHLFESYRQTRFGRPSELQSIASSYRLQISLFAPDTNSDSSGMKSRYPHVVKLAT